MQNRKPHRKKAPQTGHSIFGTILFSLLAVLAVEILLLTFTVHATRLGPQLNQNAEDILAMQVDNRSRYLQSILHDAQELTILSDTINGLTQQLLDEGEVSLSTLDSSSDAAYPLLEAAAPELISTLRIKSVTGVFLILNTHDLDKRKQDSLMPAIYLRDLDPDAAPSQRNADLTFVRAPAQLVQSLYIASVSPLNLYSRNAPFSGEHWLLVGSVPAVQLFAFAQRLQQLFSFIILITLAVGFVCSWLISRRLARSVAKLSAEAAAAEADSSAIPHLSATGIRELDQFSSAFTQLSKDVLDSSTRFLRIKIGRASCRERV